MRKKTRERLIDGIAENTTLVRGTLRGVNAQVQSQWCRVRCG
jgi:hypothetical protein